MPCAIGVTTTVEEERVSLLAGVEEVFGGVATTTLVPLTRLTSCAIGMEAITGGGDALAQGTYAPSLHVATPTQVAEALRVGPGNMPVFSGNLTDDQVRDIAAYVTQSLAQPSDIGGVGMGGLGPVAEGFIALALGIGILMLVSFWVGERQ